MKETYIIEIYDYYASNGATITELSAFNEENKINYTILNAYDSVTKGVPTYWNSTVWEKDNLFNGDKTYTSNSTGSSSSTLFIYGSGSAGQGNWARFAIETDSEITKLVISIGSPEGRVPKEIVFYKVQNSYDSSLLSSRTTNNLKQIDTLKPISTLSSVTDFEINVLEKRIAIKNPITNKSYSISDNTLIQLPDTSDKNMILHGIKKGKEIQLDVPFDKISYTQNTSEVLGSGKVFKTTINKNISIKKITLE